MQTRSLVLSLAVASCLATAGAAAAETATPNTAEWTCSKCPFGKSYEATADLGGAYVDESSAKFGDYTGLDQEGGYVLADAEGRYVGESGYDLSYELTDLGLDSRAIRLEGGRQGATTSACSTTACRTTSGTPPGARSAASAASS